MVIHNFDLMGTIRAPHKAGTPLVINADAVLALSFTLQGFELIARWNSQARQIGRGVDLQ